MGIVVIGASGHARIILDILSALNGPEIVGLLDDAPHLTGTSLDGHPILGPLSLLPALAQARRVTQVALGIGHNATRQRVFAQAAALNLVWPHLVHPSAIISPRATIGNATVICAGAVVNPGAQVGVGCIINTRASVDHDCALEDFVHIGPGATLAGNIHVGSATLVGAGATIIPGIKIGRNCIVGAGATVIRDVADGTTVAGCPARPIRPIA
jgi:acetyltransferase EpsM